VQRISPQLLTLRAFVPSGASVAYRWVLHHTEDMVDIVAATAVGKYIATEGGQAAEDKDRVRSALVDLVIAQSPRNVLHDAFAHILELAGELGDAAEVRTANWEREGIPLAGLGFSPSGPRPQAVTFAVRVQRVPTAAVAAVTAAEVAFLERPAVPGRAPYVYTPDDSGMADAEDVGRLGSLLFRPADAVQAPAHPSFEALGKDDAVRRAAQPVAMDEPGPAPATAAAEAREKDALRALDEQVRGATLYVFGGPLLAVSMRKFAELVSDETYARVSPPPPDRLWG
jgi:hypothetical protein